MRKFVSEEMVAAAIEHCQREKLNPSRGRVMGLLTQPTFGGCGGDPKNVGKMIKDYLAVHGLPLVEASPIVDSMIQPLPERLQAVLGQFSASLSGLSDTLGRELDNIRAEISVKYDQATDQIRRDANQAVEAAQCDEQDALNALEDAAAQKAELEEQLKEIMQEQTGALAVATERSEQLQRLEAELERTRTEAATDKSGLTAERDEARREAKVASGAANDRAAEITRLTASLVAVTADFNQASQQLAINQALADDRSTRIDQLEALLATALCSSREAEITTETRVSQTG